MINYLNSCPKQVEYLLLAKDAFFAVLIFSFTLKRTYFDTFYHFIIYPFVRLIVF